MWRQAADDPAPAQLEKRIGTANSTADNGLVQDLRGPLICLGPVNRRRYERLGFAGDFGAVAEGNCDQADVPQTSQTRYAPDGPVAEPALRHEMLQSLLRADRDFASYPGQAVHLSPKMNRIAQRSGSDLPQPCILL